MQNRLLSANCVLKIASTLSAMKYAFYLIINFRNENLTVFFSDLCFNHTLCILSLLSPTFEFLDLLTLSHDIYREFAEPAVCGTRASRSRDASASLAVRQALATKFSLFIFTSRLRGTSGMSQSRKPTVKNTKY